VQPGDVVLDIGTGCGVYAVAAAQAGAAHVFAVEATAAAQVARAFCDANGVGDRVTVLEGWSTQITLPVKAQVMIADIPGNDPFTSQFFEVVIDARARLLAPNARMIPRQIDLWAQPVCIVDSDRSRFAFTDSNAEQWRAWYKFDFRALSVERLLPAVIHVTGELAATWPRVGPPLLIACIDLQTVDKPIVEASVDAEATAAGQIDAVIGYSALELAPGRSRSGSPYVQDRGARWTVPVWLRPQPLVLAPRQPYRVSLSYPGSTGRTTMAVV
jgi:hypothetical protein